jgi:hypothetical protein
MAIKKRPRQWPPLEPFLPKAVKPLPAPIPATTPIRATEPEPGRFLVIFGVMILFALAVGGGYYWLDKPERAPVTVQTPPTRNSVSATIPAPTDAPSIGQIPQLAVGLRPLSPRPPDQPTSAPDTPQPTTSEPSQQPQLTVGLRPIIEQAQGAAPTPAAEATPPTALPSATAPRPKPSRKAADHGSVPVTPPPPSAGPVKF